MLSEHEIEKLSKLYYSIGEVAKMFSVNASLIRFWEKEFDFQATKKNAKGNRLYTTKDIRFFNKIYQLVKEEGFTLDGAKKALEDKKSSEKVQEKDSKNDDIIAKLEHIKERLLALSK